MILRIDPDRDSIVLPLSPADFQAKVLKYSVHNISWTQVWGVYQVESTLWMLPQPRTVLGCVVVD